MACGPGNFQTGGQRGHLRVESGYGGLDFGGGGGGGLGEGLHFFGNDGKALTGGTGVGGFDGGVEGEEIGFQSQSLNGGDGFVDTGRSGLKLGEFLDRLVQVRRRYGRLLKFGEGGS